MASCTEAGAPARPARHKRTLQRLRREAGFRSAKEFAGQIGIPPSTYARYEQSAEGPEARIPLKSAWMIADALECTIDLVVGRADIDAPDPAPVQTFYDGLSGSGQDRMDEYMRLLAYREAEMREGRW